MKKIVHPDLLADILAYCERFGVSRATFGTSALRDPCFVYDLENGRECRRVTVQRVRDFMVAHPSGLPPSRGSE